MFVNLFKELDRLLLDRLFPCFSFLRHKQFPNSQFLMILNCLPCINTGYISWVALLLWCIFYLMVPPSGYSFAIIRRHIHSFSFTYSNDFRTEDA